MPINYHYATTNKSNRIIYWIMGYGKYIPKMAYEINLSEYESPEQRNFLFIEDYEKLKDINGNVLKYKFVVNIIPKAYIL